MHHPGEGGYLRTQRIRHPTDIMTNNSAYDGLVERTAEGDDVLFVQSSGTGDRGITSGRNECSQRGGTNSLETPELPNGRLLRLNILSTWGDQNYVGLMGIEGVEIRLLTE